MTSQQTDTLVFDVCISQELVCMWEEEPHLKEVAVAV